MIVSQNPQPIPKKLVGTLSNPEIRNPPWKLNLEWSNPKIASSTWYTAKKKKKNVEDLYTENRKTQLREIKEDLS